MQILFRGLLILAASVVPSLCSGAALTQATLETQFGRTVQPFLENYCVTCHGKEEPEAEMDLSGFTSMRAFIQDGRRWSQILERLEADEMPPSKAKKHPPARERDEAVKWFHAMRDFEIARNAGDPGLVLARRLSNVEYNYSVRDLTGVDIRPTREFPVDPANTAGFDNSGETLVMSPTLLKKYLGAAREVASHLYLQEDGFRFASHPMISEADREKFCVMQIIDLYHQHNTDYAEYFQAAWRYRHRRVLGQPNATLETIARDSRVSAKYLATVWSLLEKPEEVGPLVKLQQMWRALPVPAQGQWELARAGSVAMKEYVAGVRKKVEPRFLNITAGRFGAAWQPLLIWKNEQYARHRRSFDRRQLQVEGLLQMDISGLEEAEWENAFGPGRTILVENKPGDPDLVVPQAQRAAYEAAWGRFCSVFPDMFYMESRGRHYFNVGRDQGRYLSAGFHNVMGYFRDDWPLYELILDEKEQATLDRMWRELDFIASVNIRTYTQFATLGTRGTRDDFKDGEPLVMHVDEQEIIGEPSIKKLEAEYLEIAKGGSRSAYGAVQDFFRSYNDGIRWVQKARREAEPKHLQSLLDFAARAYRRPLTREDREDLTSFYRAARDKVGGDHETALRETVVLVLMSPEFGYRVDLVDAGRGVQALSDHDLASRLSYFLWSSVPDAELLKHAQAGDLHEPRVLAAQARRMVKDPRIRALAVEFGGNWLDIRDFEKIATVDRDRFTTFDDKLRQAMFEEPVRFLLDVFQNNRSLLDCLHGDYTFVNAALAKHYGMPGPVEAVQTRQVFRTEPTLSVRRLRQGADRNETRGETLEAPVLGVNTSGETWTRIEGAGEYGRGGLLPMAVFLTKNAPGLRTSPVKRGYWVVKNVLGERIPPPPPTVPELPKDEAKMDLPLRDMLARHREDPNCAACHARFDSFGLAFESYGPIGDRRTRDLANRPVDTRATFPGGSEGDGLKGVRDYIKAHREKDFVHNFSSKMLAYALGRSLMITDEPLLADIQRKLAANGNRFETVIESIVTSRQFLNKRGREDLAANSQ
jgi:hypothetical protein